MSAVADDRFEPRLERQRGEARCRHLATDRFGRHARVEARFILARATGRQTSRLVVSDTGSEANVGAAAALVVASYGLLASTCG
jgi:hypothetical protein